MTTTRRSPRTRRIAAGLLLALTAALMAVPATTTLAADGDTLALPKVDVTPRVSDFDTPGARSRGVALRMTRVAGFTNRIPRDGDPQSERTEVYLGMDDEAIHAAFVCFDREPQLVRAHLSGRDVIPGGDDTVAFQLDTFRDQIHAYGFQTNALGVQQDGVWTEGAGWDMSFDTLWRSEGRRTDEGYVVVLSIPFKSLRFAPDSDRSFGLMMFRGIARTNEQGFWPRYSTTIAGRMNQAGVLTGLGGAAPGRNLRVTPYLNARSFRTVDLATQGAGTAIEDPFDAQAGFDLKLVPRDSVSLDLAVNPDFSQVESDEPQVTVNQRFEVFFPEKRPFFLENATFFDTPIPLFFSRRILDPRIGGRLTGRFGATSVGALAARDSAGRGSFAAVARVNRDLGLQSTAGFFGSVREEGGARNSVASVDARVRMGSAWSTRLQGAFSASSETGGRRRSGFAGRVLAQRSGRAFTYSADLNERTADFESALGYIDRTDYRSLDQQAALRRFPSGRSLLSWGPDLTLAVVQDRNGHLLEHRVRPSLTFDWPRLTQIFLFRQIGEVRLRREEFATGSGEAAISEPFSQNQWGAAFTSSPTAAVSVQADATLGHAINFAPASGDAISTARETAWRGSLELRPGARAAFTVTGLRTALRAPTGAASIFTNSIVRARTQFQFTRALSVRAIMERDMLSTTPRLTSLQPYRRLNVDILISYLVSPGTAIFAGYNNELTDPDLPLRGLTTPLAWRPPSRLVSTGRQFFVKLSYMFRR